MMEQTTYLYIDFYWIQLFECNMVYINGVGKGIDGATARVENVFDATYITLNKNSLLGQMYFFVMYLDVRDSSIFLGPCADITLFIYCALYQNTVSVSRKLKVASLHGIEVYRIYGKATGKFFDVQMF